MIESIDVDWRTGREELFDRARHRRQLSRLPGRLALNMLHRLLRSFWLRDEYPAPWMFRLPSGSVRGLLSPSALGSAQIAQPLVLRAADRPEGRKCCWRWRMGSRARTSFRPESKRALRSDDSSAPDRTASDESEANALV